jgi:hypothetical protein
MGLDYENRGLASFSKIKILKSKFNFTDPSSVDFDICKCVEYQVYGKDGGQSWEQDVSGAWIKAYSGDTVLFVLKKDGVIVDNPVAKSFVKDIHSKYCQIDWTDQLLVNGIGCYELSINYTIGGVADTIIWAEYHLNEFDILKVKNTVRFKSIFNSNQSIEEIDFTNSKVIDTVRFDGYFGDRQPNTFIDNIIYSNKSMNKVVRENLNKYYLESKNLPIIFIDKIIDLHLLSENEVYVSDYNFKNPVKYYLDFPCIVSESAEIEYIDGVDKPSFKCIFSDKIKNSKSYY